MAKFKFKLPKLKFAVFIAPIAVIVTIVIIAVSLRVCIIKIGVDQVGVCTVVWGIKRGIVNRDFGPGWHRNIPGTVEWDIYDSTVQTLEMTEEHTGTKGNEERDVLKVRTKDDYDVSVDLIIKYWIKKGEAWALRQDIGSAERYKQIVENEARDIARSVFGKMGEVDLYNPIEKRKRALEGKEMHNMSLKNRHVEIVDWLILDIRFDPGLDRKIKSIKVAELEEILNISKGMAANQRGITQTIDAETEAVSMEITGDKKRKLTVMDARTKNKIIEIMAKSNQYMVEKRAEGDRYKAEKIAEGSFLNAKANADGEKLRRNAMTGLGGNMIVAIEAAKNLNLADLVISTESIDLLDVDEMVSKLGIKNEVELTELLEKLKNADKDTVEDNKNKDVYDENYDYDYGVETSKDDKQHDVYGKDYNYDTEAGNSQTGEKNNDEKDTVDEKEPGNDNEDSSGNSGTMRYIP